MTQIIEKTIVLLLFIGLFLPITHAQTVYTINDVPNVHLQDRNAYVSDPEQQLAIEDIETINTELRFFEDSLGVQCAVIVVPEIDTEPSEFALDLFNKWGVGYKGTDRGLLILLVYGGGEGNRDIHMTTGYGLEGDLPDALCKHIQIEAMLPLLKEERFGEGLLAGVQETRRLLENEEQRNELAQQIENQEDDELLSALYYWTLLTGILLSVAALIRILIVIVEKDPYQKYMYNSGLDLGLDLGNNAEDVVGRVIIAVLLLPSSIVYVIIGRLLMKYVRSRLRCIDCGSPNIQKPFSTTIRIATEAQDGLVEHYFTCQDCHYKHVIEETIEYSSSYSGGSSSSGSSGGSWGGGSSGGGGAGSSF